ncbi:uncharacterized protein LOC110650937 [Hevea brasiliensis]|uniref:uncharacterized protein LOC110650937 n=1 Tax=Hevea brasiliensis TaxID=3981 RepID=UPI0025F9CB71|nr:uncharacterized protein LOC110650937 [Hevea brasiliensis]
MTPMTDIEATPIHDGMGPPMRSQAWNPYAPMSPSSFDQWILLLLIPPPASILLMVGTMKDHISCQTHWFAYTGPKMNLSLVSSGRCSSIDGEFLLIESIHFSSIFMVAFHYPGWWP